MPLREDQKERRNKRLEKIKKKREGTKEAKLRRRREAIRKNRKYEQQIEEDVKRNQPKLKPIRNADIQAKKEDTRKRLEENLKVLKALEEEYEKEMAAKKERNENLEAQGYTTFQDKMDAINRQAMEDLKRLEAGRDSGDFGEFEGTMMKNWEMEKDAKEALSSENFSQMLKEAQESTEKAIADLEPKRKGKPAGANTIADLFGGSASCVAKDKNGNVLHTSGLEPEEKS